VSPPPTLGAAAAEAPGGISYADPITTELIRHSLNSAASQMKRALVRTAFAPMIYEVLGFTVALSFVTMPAP
jgi:N-methylhydantoinase B